MCIRDSAYSMAFRLTHNPLYRTVAEKTAGYVLRELAAPAGGFYSAEDADSEVVEGKYYTFDTAELPRLLGADIGTLFNRYYGISPGGNFEGKSIPNLLHAEEFTEDVYKRQIHRIPLVRSAMRTRSSTSPFSCLTCSARVQPCLLRNPSAQGTNGV